MGATEMQMTCYRNFLGIDFKIDVDYRWIGGSVHQPELEIRDVWIVGYHAPDGHYIPVSAEAILDEMSASEYDSLLEQATREFPAAYREEAVESYYAIRSEDYA